MKDKFEMENTSACTTGRVLNWANFGLSGVAGLMSEVGAGNAIVIENLELHFKHVWDSLEQFIHILQV